MNKSTCRVDGCESLNHSRFLCRSHYDRSRITGNLPASKRPTRPQSGCKIEDCPRPLKARGLCAIHYQPERERTGVPCAVDGCDRPSICRGWCRSHYWRWRKHGSPVATPVWRDLAKDAPEGTRLCRTCKEFRPVEEFRIRKEREGAPRSSKCRPCVAQNWQDNRERNLAAKAANNFGITPNLYQELVNGSCHVCGSKNNQSGRRLHIDHCHATGKVRGALCHACNTSLGLANDDPIRLRALAEYVERHQGG